MMHSAFKLITLLLVAINFSFSQTSKTSFYEGPFADVRAEAKRTKTPILLDFTASWCKHCQKVEQNLFQDKTIAEKINSNYIAYQVDLASADGKALVKKYNITEFPSYVLINENEKMISVIKGNHSAGQFYNKMELAKNVTTTTQKAKADSDKKWWKFW